jgi:ABC-2 type transport system permease protein
LGHLLPSALATIPPVWVCVGLALAIFGSAPKVVYVAWALLAAFVVVGEFGPLFNLPQPVIDVSPFVHAVVLPGSTVVAAPLAVLFAIAAALVVLAQTTFRRRDIGA